MHLTSENTAIVLDSTSDYPEAKARERFDNIRVVPLHVLFGSEDFLDHVGHLRARLLRAPEGRYGAADHLAADTRRVPARVRGSCAVRPHLLAPPVPEALGHLPVRGAGCRDRRRRPDPARRLGDRLARGRDARARDRAASRPWHDGRRARGADRPLQAGQHGRLHGRHARVPAEGWADRQGPGARRTLC